MQQFFENQQNQHSGALTTTTTNECSLHEYPRKISSSEPAKRMIVDGYIISLSRL